MPIDQPDHYVSRPHPDAGPREPRIVAAIRLTIRQSKGRPVVLDDLLSGLHLNRFVPAVTRDELREHLKRMIADGQVVKVPVRMDWGPVAGFRLGGN